MWWKGDSHLQFLWVQISAAIIESIMEFSLKLKIELLYHPLTPLLYINLKKNTNSKRNMHPSVRSSIIYNCQDIETF